ncbi:hypothetical protein R6Q59_022890 [Mikania micrantha]
MMNKLITTLCLFALFGLNNADIQANRLFKLLMSKSSKNSHIANQWMVSEEVDEYSPVYIAPQNGLAELDKISALPGQPEGVDFNQYSGYVTVNPTAGRSSFLLFRRVTYRFFYKAIGFVAKWR